MKSTGNINKSQKSCLTGILKLFVACSSWRILKHRLNDIIDYHLIRIFELFKDTSKIPTFTLSISFKILSCNFCFLKNLIDFKGIILQPTGKLNPKFLRENLILNFFKAGIFQIKHLFTSSISFLSNPIFLLLTFILRFVYILGTCSL